MIEAYIRPAYQKILVNPMALLLVRNPRIAANSITALSGITGLLIPLMLIAGMPILAVVLLIISGYLDTLDGTLARVKHQASPLGSVLDIVTDRLVEFAVIIGLFAISPQSRGLACMFMLGSTLLCVTSFLVVGIFSENNSEKSFHYSPGLMERFEAFVLFALMMLLPSQFLWLAWLYTTLVFVTVVIRIWEFRRQV